MADTKSKLKFKSGDPIYDAQGKLMGFFNGPTLINPAPTGQAVQGAAQAAPSILGATAPTQTAPAPAAQQPQQMVQQPQQPVQPMPQAQAPRPVQSNSYTPPNSMGNYFSQLQQVQAQQQRQQPQQQQRPVTAPQQQQPQAAVQNLASQYQQYQRPQAVPTPQLLHQNFFQSALSNVGQAGQNFGNALGQGAQKVGSFIGGLFNR